ncbi:OLC1v1008636C1 [Oldenlandia corymbosa var. corymbosa]|uniref:OLC1v1008636C1 n=1 Tax=Oldenlandia corymbosa var. corymbosa TaxID=529605 RepID=A0AAV1DQF3_OLDCO|nr:OLC1v1008636C1 [Oldenlandia corymbosa var. corymbosa]
MYPTLESEDDEFEKLVAPHRLSLVGKFSYGRPKIEKIHKVFKKIGFNGGYTLGLMNPRHVLIRFEQEDDYQRCWIRTFWNIAGFSMRILKWKLGFRFEEDPLVVPIWVSLFDLPVEYMYPEVIYSMATAIGKPLKIDKPTLNMTRPFGARFFVEVDLTKEFPKSVKIGKKGRKHEHVFTYEHVPFYCSKCCKIGHKEINCRVGKPLPLKSDSGKEKNPAVVKKGVKLHGPKVILGSKRSQGQGDPKVDIINMNPLIVRGVESKKSQLVSTPAETLIAPSPPPAPTLERNEPATMQHDDLNRSSEVPQSNKCLVLQVIDDAGDNDEDVEDVFTEERGDRELAVIDKDNLLRAEDDSMTKQQFFPDDSFEPKCEDDVEDLHVGRWSEGEKEEADLVRKDQGELSVKSKRGRKSKTEQAKLLEGKELWRSLRLQ